LLRAAVATGRLLQRAVAARQQRQFIVWAASAYRRAACLGSHWYTETRGGW